ncbi:hypothetical protein MMC20_008005 [Loxospora ochrophaea]|nr:hypothetical protein [Loxospora ochrophaea]
MLSSPSWLLSTIACLLLSSFVTSHTVITYPGWRGDNLQQNSTANATSGLGVGPNNTYPYGMQWIYPCGGMPSTTNRSLWPVSGGAIALQPGWFQGHATALFYINLGEGTIPINMSLPMVSVFEITGPSKEPYPGGFCLPQVPLPANFTANIGDNATIQVVETAVHGAALYSCVDITFADPKDVPEVNASNCANSSDIGFQQVFTTTSLSGAEALYSPPASLLASIPLFVAFFWAFFI